MNVWLNPLFNCIYTFHMPLFIFISGYFFPSALKRSFKELATKKIKRLLLPALVYSTSIIILYVLITGDIHLKAYFLYNQYKTYWFLICVFLLTFAYWLFFRSEKKEKCILIITYLLLLIFYDYLPRYVLKDCQLIRQTFIFGFGAYLSIYERDGLKSIWLDIRGVGIFLILATIASIIRFFYGFNMMDYPPIVRICDGFVCSMLVFYLIYPMFRKVTNHNLGWLAYVGRNSLAIYLVHVVFSRVYLFLGVHIEYTLSNVFLISVCWIILSLIYIYIIKFIFKEKSYIFGV